MKEMPLIKTVYVFRIIRIKYYRKKKRGKIHGKIWSCTPQKKIIHFEVRCRWLSTFLL